MADEIIKLIEYLTGNVVFVGAVIAYIIFFAIVATIAIAIIVKTWRAISRNKK